MMDLDNIYHGNSIEVLKQFADDSIDCIVTSPPYWNLRDYGTANWVGGTDPHCDHKIPESENSKKSKYCFKCGAKRVDTQLGLESTFEEYINNLCNIFDEVKRTLKSSGTCWVNIGDTYMNTNSDKCQKKSLCQIPSRFAIEMANRGWILRNEIIWHKGNQMPSSCKDRFTVDFEKVFFFTKCSKNYFFETQYEPLSINSDLNYRIKLRENKTYNTKEAYKDNQPLSSKTEFKDKRIKRAVWSINTKPFKGAHNATYPVELIRPMIDAGCPVGGVILDPFMGAGTTAIVAIEQKKHYVGIELNLENIKLSENRISKFKHDTSLIEDIID